MPQLSILDLSFTTTATPARAALEQTVALAQTAEALGYHRFWVSEHHNLASVAGSSPEIMIGQIAARTRHLRVGSGGVMLPNHAPLMVAERFRTLEAFFPGRIDLGIGRAPGTDPVTSFALRHRDAAAGGDDFLERLGELQAWGSGDFPADHPFRTVRAMPDDAPLPPIHLLGSSDYSARLAGHLGLGFAFAHHFASYDAVDALQLYRAQFRPTAGRARPHAILTVAAICADTDAEAEFHAASADLNALRRRRGEFVPLESPEAALRATHSASDRAVIAVNRQRLFVGSPKTLERSLTPLLRTTEADELMLVTAMFDPQARLRSYTLLSQQFGPDRQVLDA